MHQFPFLLQLKQIKVTANAIFLKEYFHKCGFSKIVQIPLSRSGKCNLRLSHDVISHIMNMVKWSSSRPRTGLQGLGALYLVQNPELFVCYKIKIMFDFSLFLLASPEGVLMGCEHDCLVLTSQHQQHNVQ